MGGLVVGAVHLSWAPLGPRISGGVGGLGGEGRGKGNGKRESGDDDAQFEM